MKYSFRATVKYIVTKMVQSFIKLLYVCPIDDNKMLFFSFDGKQFSDSPKYICDYYLNTKYDVVWGFNDEQKWKKILPTNIRSVKKESFLFLKEFVTAKVIVTNDFIASYLPVRKGQILLNTWHGGSPLKTVGMADEKYEKDDDLFFKLHSNKYTAILSSSQFMTDEVFVKSLCLKGSILEYGMPRNDIFFQKDLNIKKKVYDCLGIDNYNVGLVLYAPTFRGNGDFIPKEQQLDSDITVDALRKKFDKDFVFAFRAHHTMSKECFGTECIKASDYPDMQELLYVADILITDYSSCMGDFAYTKKPTFLYIPDVEEYMKDRGFYWDIHTLPFMIARNQEELNQRILTYDEDEYQNGIDKYFARLGSYEKGNATQLTCDWINMKIKKSEGEKNEKTRI